MAGPEKETIEVEMKLTTSEGVIVPISVVVEYPRNYGFYAVKGVEGLAEQGQLYSQMINRNDLSTLRVMAEAADARGEG